MIVSIHQPNFFPWMPFFEKMQQADIFIILENCQYEKGGYQNRFNIGADWYTMSVNGGLHPISQKKYVQAKSDWKSIKARLPQYSKILSRFDTFIGENLASTNFLILQEIAGILKIRTRLVFDVETKLTGTDRLVYLCQIHRATHYIAGPSSSKYLVPERFHRAKIQIVHPKPPTSKPILEILSKKL